ELTQCGGKWQQRVSRSKVKAADLFSGTGRASADSDGELSDDDPIEDPDFQPNFADDSDESFPLDEAEDTLDPSSSLVPKKDTRRIWKHEDIEEFQVPDASFETPDALQSPFQYFKMLFTDEMIDHIAYHTNLYSAQELGDTIKTSPKEIEDFLAILLFMGVFNFPSLEDYWHHESRFSVIADIMPKKRFQLFRRFIHFSDNQQHKGWQSPSIYCVLPSKFICEEEQMLPLGAKVVTTLCQTITQPRLSVVFCDNYFTSFKLVQHLDTSLGVKCIGTVRPNRTGGATLMTDKELMKRGRRAFDYRSAEGVIAVKWFDNKCVNLLSNASGIMPLSTVKHWSKESKAKVMIPCPSLIPAYNEHMGGIDLSDMLVHLYKTPAKSTRWYLPLFGYMLDLSIANSWLVYKRECGQLNQKPITLKRFRLAVAPSQPQPDVRYDCFGHWPLHFDKRGRCNYCPKGVSRWKCQKCNVFLCLNASQECFAVYHQKI
uniref:PiggyBac transposable element-derived protein domain-containing protein n=1 Tax=Maylandia zebra TaxID=106582 RepID=A0A3P9CMK6_9CICH